MNKIIPYEGSETASYQTIMGFPFKPTDTSLSLADIKNNGSLSKTAVFVDLLVIVRYLKTSREIKNERGNFTVRDVIVMDRSLPGMLLSIWNQEIIERLCKIEGLLNNLNQNKQFS